MTDPAPCPFCSSANIKLFIGLSEIHDGEVHCENCGATSGNHPTEAEALAAWSARTVHNDLVGALKACHAQFNFYATEHRNAGKHEKAATNQRFADLCADALTRATGAAS